MSAATSTPSGGVWEAIESERRRDRLIKRVSVTAWTITFLLVVALAAIKVEQTVYLAKTMMGGLGWQLALPAMMPLVIVAGVLSVLIATLSTVAIFLRLRTASLNEIQLRLAALEDMMVAHTNSAK